MSERHRVITETGDKISAVHHPPAGESEDWIFFCHGFGSNKRGSYIKRCDYYAEKGINAVRFDFRGNGDSEGKFIEQTLTSRLDDLKEVISYFEPENYILFGSSFGGKVVLTHASANDPELVICKAPVTFNSIMDMFRSVVEEKGKFTYHENATIDERFFQDFDTYSFKEDSKSIECPVAIFHGGEDTTVHPEKSLKAAEHLENTVFVQKLKGEEHSFSEDAEDYMLDMSYRWIEAISRLK